MISLALLEDDIVEIAIIGNVLGVQRTEAAMFIPQASLGNSVLELISGIPIVFWA